MFYTTIYKLIIMLSKNKIFGVLLILVILSTLSVCFASDFKSECKPLDYKQMEKNSAKFVGNPVTASGSVFQIMESGNYGLILMHVDDDSSQTLAVMYEGSNDIVEDDHITVYGNATVDYSYESQAGLKLTVPCVLAESKYIEKN